MRVAIIGAGPSGLACALTLERRGIHPDIFERSSKVGYGVPRVEVLLQLFQRPHRDQLRYLSNNFGIKFRPLAKLYKQVICTPRYAVPVKGYLGYLVERGQNRHAVEVQLAGQLHAKIKYNIHADYRALAGAYDYVVVADGNHAAASTLNIWKTTITAWVKGATVLGRFDPGAAVIYFNTAYAGHGFGCLVPFNQERALLALQVPDTSQSALRCNWNRFLEQESICPEIIETFEIHHTGGVTTRQQVDNILLTGHSGGFTDNFLGLGLLSSMQSGALAGKAIAEGLNYEQMVRPLIRQVERLTAFRAAFNTLDNKALDRLVYTLTLPGIKQVIYNTNIDIISLIHPLLPKVSLNK